MIARWKKISLSIVGGIALLAAAGVWSFHALLSGMCANESLFEVPSPDGTLKAIVFQRDCGATTGFSTQISILKTNQSLPNESGNLFVADTDRGRVPSGPGGGPEVRVTWIAPRSLRVAHHQDARVYLANHNASGVSAEYADFR
jgi:hypothetical protein